MKVVVQRSLKASVTVDKKIVGQIDSGLVLLVGFTNGDNTAILEKMVNKIINLRIFDDENNVMNKSLLDVQGQVLSISQFTLYASTTKGRRPSYEQALTAELSNKLYNEFNDLLKQHVKVETGIFQADMQVELINDGPVTIILSSNT